MHLNGCQYLFVRRNNILVDESCKLCFNRFIYNDRQIVILIFFWILKFALFSSNNFCFNDCILIFTMYYFSLNTLFVSRRGGGGWHTWTLIQILVKPPDLSPVRHCIFENNSCGVFFFCLEYSGIGSPIHLYLFILLFLHIWSLFLPWVISQLINFSTSQVRKRQNNVSYSSSVEGEKIRKGLQLFQMSVPADPRSTSFLPHCPGYEPLLTCSSTSALLRDAANPAEPGCIGGNTHDSSMPVRLPIVLLP